MPRERYSIGVPDQGFYREVFNTDSGLFGGSNMGNGGGVLSSAKPCHGRENSIAITLPPLAMVAFKCEPRHES